MVGLALLLAVAGQFGALSPFQGIFLNVASPVESVLTAVFRPVAIVLSKADEISDLEEANRRLRLENESLRAQLLEKEQQTTELVELREALGIVSEAAEWAPVAASVVSRDPSPFSDVVRINQGSSAGIRSGMVVLSAGGSLVGTVTDVFGDQAFVRLITDSRSAVNAQVFETKIDGSLKGTAKKELQLALAQGDITVGDTVVTSGVGDNYPAGLPIGRVSAVSGSAQDVFRNVKVEPSVRMSTLRTVLVLTGFQTSRLEGGD